MERVFKCICLYNSYRVLFICYISENKEHEELMDKTIHLPRGLGNFYIGYYGQLRGRPKASGTKL
ncbi:unnamed protein product [Fusarium graminearum]|nr:unnamed protein product [Fusarium graminearum]